MMASGTGRSGHGRVPFAALLAAAALFSVPAAGQQVTSVELQALSPVCRAVLSPGTTSREERLQPYAHLLPGACGIIHTCGGEIAMLRYQRAMSMAYLPSDAESKARAERTRNSYLQTAVAEYGYEIRCAQPGYPLLPSILTGRGNALSHQGKHAEAIQDLQRALQLNPAYAPAQSGLALARARMATAAAMPRK